MGRNFHKPTVSVIGGDKRSEILAELLTESGYDTIYAEDNDTIRSALNRRCIVLPLPVTRDGRTLNSQAVNDTVLLVDIINNIHPHSRILCGGLSEALKTDIENTGARAVDYYNREQVLLDNAYLTAEGVLKLLIENTDTAVIDKKILIIGSGRCGKATALLLKKIGCDVTVASRKAGLVGFDLLNRIKIKNTADISQYIADFDVVINTAPVLVLDREVLSATRNDTLILELATAHAGVDANVATELGIKTVYAPALPGKYSPTSAAKILYNSIIQIISEEFA